MHPSKIKYAFLWLNKQFEIYQIREVWQNKGKSERISLFWLGAYHRNSYQVMTSIHGVVISLQNCIFGLLATTNKKSIMHRYSCD